MTFSIRILVVLGLVAQLALSGQCCAIFAGNDHDADHSNECDSMCKPAPSSCCTPSPQVEHAACLPGSPVNDTGDCDDCDDCITALKNPQDAMLTAEQEIPAMTLVAMPLANFIGQVEPFRLERHLRRAADRAPPTNTRLARLCVWRN